MRRAAIVLVAGAGVALMALAPQVDDGSATQMRMLSGARLVCPALAGSPGLRSEVSALVVPDPQEVTRPALATATSDGGAGGPAGPDSAGAVPPQLPVAVLRAVDADVDVARISASGSPVSLFVDGQSQPPLVLDASGAFAPAAVAGVASFAASGPGAGLASAACSSPEAEWWFVGSGSQLGRGSTLLVTNPADEPVRVDLRLFARSGPLEALGGSAVTLGPRSRVRLRLDALAPPEPVLAVQVRATNGRVVAALRDIAQPRGDLRRGVDFIPAAVAPSTVIRIGGIPAGPGDREIILVNPGSEFATVDIAMVGQDGPAVVPEPSTLVVPARSLMSTSLDRFLAGQSATLELTSDVPITGVVRGDWGAQERDTAWYAATPAVEPPNALAAAALVPTGPGLAVSVTVAAPEGPVRGTLRVITTGSAADSLFGDRPSPLPDVGDGGGAAPVDGPRVNTGPVQVRDPVVVEVPAGSQRTVLLPGLREVGAAHVMWVSDADAGPAQISHLVVDVERSLATGYSWWPARSAVPVAPVREDAGILVPSG